MRSSRATFLATCGVLVGSWCPPQAATAGASERAARRHILQGCYSHPFMTAGDTTSIACDGAFFRLVAAPKDAKAKEGQALTGPESGEELQKALKQMFPETGPSGIKTQEAQRLFNWMRLKVRWSETDWQKLEKSYRQDPIASPADRLHRSGRAVDQFGGVWVARVKPAPARARAAAPSSPGAGGAPEASQASKAPKQKEADRLHAVLLREMVADESMLGYLVTVNLKDEVQSVKVLRTAEEWTGAKASLAAADGAPAR
ncbi:MAG: hypothetical protein HY554_09740 [Elusimicrobia bacterium]|nr:hypothetical protein [Elusimicrobiota bacterium]